MLFNACNGRLDLPAFRMDYIRFGSGKPTMIILNTKKGCGVKWIEDLGTGNHNTNVTEEQAAAAIAEIRGN